jgi:hypothetical protein
MGLSALDLSICVISFVVGVYIHRLTKGEIMKLDVFAAPIALDAGRRLAASAMPDAPVVAERPTLRKPRLRAALRLRRQEA